MIIGRDAPDPLAIRRHVRIAHLERIRLPAGACRIVHRVVVKVLP
jgi:hypothetical protein